MKLSTPLVLVYHGVCKGDALAFNSRFIPESEFEKHLNFFKNECKVLSLDEISTPVNKDKLSIIITFDDGYLNNLTNAVPLLEKYGLPASFCVCNPNENQILWSDALDIAVKMYPEDSVELKGKRFILGREKSFIRDTIIRGTYKEMDDLIHQALDKIKDMSDLNEYWQLMSEEDLKAIDENKHFKLIPHGSRHVSASYAQDQLWQKDFSDSVTYIQSISKEKVSCFAYPYGHVNMDVVKYLRERHGIRQHLLVDSMGTGNDLVPRFVINPHISFDLLKRFMYWGKY